MSKSFQVSFLNQSLDQNTLRILYLRNKVYIFPFLVVVIAVSLFFFAVLPQIQNYFLVQAEVKQSEERIVVLKNNIAVLSAINTSDLDSKVQTVISALPADKDFAGILHVIGQAASDSNVKLGDFSFAVGSLASEATKITNVLPIEITVTITSDLVGTKRFLESLTRRFPLSEVQALQMTQSSSTIKIVFYYKPLPQFVLQDNQKLVPLSKEEFKLFETLTSFSSL